MKRIWAVFLAAAMLLCCAACGPEHASVQAEDAADAMRGGWASYFDSFASSPGQAPQETAPASQPQAVHGRQAVCKFFATPVENARILCYNPFIPIR